MPHPFQDTLFAFIGEPARCTRREARDALDAVGGVVDERVSAFTKYVVAFRHNGKTNKYKQAVESDRIGMLTLLNEQQFFDILEGKTEPPARLKTNNTIVIPSLDPEAEAREQERTWQDILNSKRMKNMAKYGVPTPDGGRAKVDLRPLDMMRRLREQMDENTLQTLTARTRNLLSERYMGDDGYFTGDKAVGYIEYNRERDACDIIIDGKPYTWAELEKNISAREGWGIKIVFGEAGDDPSGEEHK